MPSRTIATTSASGSSGEAIVAANDFLVLAGFSVSETDGSAAAAEVAIRHGSASGAYLIPPMNLDANGFGFFWMGSKGISAPNGIYVDKISGTTTVTVYTYKA